MSNFVELLTFVDIQERVHGSRYCHWGSWVDIVHKGNFFYKWRSFFLLLFTMSGEPYILSYGHGPQPTSSPISQATHQRYEYMSYHKVGYIDISIMPITLLWSLFSKSGQIAPTFEVAERDLLISIFYYVLSLLNEHRLPHTTSS